MEQGVTPRQEVERALRRWLRAHHSVIGRYEARRVGASEDVIDAKLTVGEWARMYTAVYRDTAAPETPYQVLRAASVATRVGVVSHASAAWLWGLLPNFPTRPELTVRSMPGEVRRPNGLTIHRSADLDPSQAVLREGMLVTNPLRTIVDLAGSRSLSPSDLTDAIDAVLGKRLVTVAALTAELDRLARSGRPGIARLRWHLLDRGFIGAPEPSVLESKMGRIIVAAHLPLPMVEYKVGEDGEYRLDFAWPAILLAVEVDGYIFHFTPAHLQRDHTRRNQLQQAGWTVLVYTWKEVCNEPSRVAREISATYHARIA
jgi:hypothetical protein